MRGVEEARKLSADRLDQQLPGKVAELRARYGVAATGLDGKDARGTLPDVALVAAHGRLELGAHEWPAVLVTRTSTPSIIMVETGPGSPLYLVTYRLRAYIYVRGNDYDDVTDRVDRYTLGVRELLLSNLGLAAQSDLGATILPDGMVEDYSDIEPDINGRSTGGAFIEYAIRLEEEAGATVVPPATGEPDVASATLTVIPAHPALD